MKEGNLLFKHKEQDLIKTYVNMQQTPNPKEEREKRNFKFLYKNFLTFV